MSCFVRGFGDVMMKLLPEYAENIIVAVVHRGRWMWLVTEKDDWFLDYPKWERGFLENGYVLPDGASEARFGIHILNERSIDLYLEKMQENVASVEELSELLGMYEPIERSDEIVEAMPSVLANFDEKRLMNNFPEPSGMFHDFMPVGWTGRYGWSLDEVPNAQKYWIAGERNYFAAGSSEGRP